MTEKTPSTNSELPLSGAVALVSGAGGPMGAAIAKRLAADGASLGLIDISGRRVAATTENIQSNYPNIKVHMARANATDESETNTAIAEIVENLGPVTILINVVGGIRGGELITPLLGMTEERFDSTFALNLKPLFWMVQAVAPHMVARKKGAIVNISSVTYAGDGDQPEYAAAKAAVSSLTRSLAIELAPNVRVNCIVPGLIQTSVIEKAAPDMVKDYTNRSLLKRLGQPEDIAGAVSFLVGPDSNFITGVALPVSGGITASL
ncbi:SDR family NAD(P)-dependent oxidoreductase [uncultured Sneathiella sp.]|jgi:NAD(P)-dependent dehydrogenase (short-subunit alcohol dehydrogenase family)|uniref:SDR family NAD(P)-dependent oxidoreductase n=1 Tax=uncultured Sneathiella sp. TaxID=879315 RepID=UPI0030DA34D9|tara:strand:- start:2392 stop:3183 length:792 start_codon:yes stop_codon:yes gene_type:complete